MVASAECYSYPTNMLVAATISIRHLFPESTQMLQHSIRLGIARSYGRTRIRLRPRSPKGIMDMPKIRPCRKD